MTPLLIAARALVKHFPSGAAGLGLLMGKSNLADELNPNLRKSKLGLEDAVEMEILANDFRILHAHCAMTRHYPPVPMPDPAPDADPQCMTTLSEMVKESADVVAVTVAGLADNDVSADDLARFDKEWGELVVKGQALRQQLANKHARARAGAA